MGGNETFRKPAEGGEAAAPQARASMPNVQEIRAALMSPRRREGVPIEEALRDREAGIGPFAWTEAASAKLAGALSPATVPAITPAVLLNAAKTAYDTSVTLASGYLSFAFSTGHPYVVIADTAVSAYLVYHYRTKAVLPVAAFNLAALVTYSFEPALFSETINAAEALAQDYVSWAFSTGTLHGVEVLLGTVVAAYAAYYGAVELYRRKRKKNQSDGPGKEKP
jgi:predicted membrane protein